MSWADVKRQLPARLVKKKKVCLHSNMHPVPNFLIVMNLYMWLFFFDFFDSLRTYNLDIKKLDGSLPANPVNERRVANAVTLKSTFRLP